MQSLHHPDRSQYGKRQNIDHEYNTEKQGTDPEAADWIYTRMPPHTMFIGEIVDVIER